MDDIDAAAPAGAANEADIASHQDNPSPAPAETPAQRIERAIAAWVVDRIHNSPVSRDTEAFSHLMTALAELGPRIAKEI